MRRVSHFIQQCNFSTYKTNQQAIYYQSLPCMWLWGCRHTVCNSSVSHLSTNSRLFNDVLHDSGGKYFIWSMVVDHKCSTKHTQGNWKRQRQQSRQKLRQNCAVLGSSAFSFKAFLKSWHFCSKVRFVFFKNVNYRSMQQFLATSLTKSLTNATAKPKCNIVSSSIF